MKTNEVKKAYEVQGGALVDSMPIIIFDVETTGLNPDFCKIIQISAMKMDAETWKPTGETLDIIINPEEPLPEKITEITGYTDSFLSKYKPEREEFENILNFFGENPYVLGHNVSFDIKFVQSMYKRYGKRFSPLGEIDTLAMARQLLKKGKDVENHKLGTVAHYYGVDTDLSFHEAQDDIKATYRIFISMLPDEVEEVVLKPKATSVNFTPGYRGHERLYFNTSEGSMWWDNLDKKFDSKDFDVQVADLDDAVNTICEKWYVDDIEALFKKVKNWWTKNQLKKIGEEFKCNLSEEKKLNDYLKRNRFFNYTKSIKDNIVTIVLTDFVKTGKGKCIS